MNISRLSTPILGLAIAVFALGFMSPSLPGKPDSNGFHSHKQDCGGDPPDPTTEATFSVELQEGTNSGVVTTTSCVGLTKGPKLSAEFPGDFSTNSDRSGCAEYTISGGAYNGTEIRLGEIAVTQKNSRVILFFTSEPSFQYPNNTFGYQTQRLAATMEPGPPGSSFQLRVNKTATLTKSHQPDKRLDVGYINIGIIVYTAVPSE